MLANISEETNCDVLALANVTAVGFAFAAQEVPEVPVEPTDQRLDAILTEFGPVALRG